LPQPSGLRNDGNDGSAAKAWDKGMRTSVIVVPLAQAFSREQSVAGGT